ncbi:uncharacterized protein [Panulirus ornatus]|uniref:uncharacterized protein isoform X2 n=1 Tax=Panulirus ornatus TaxID=150431 RepID=UPI003A896458
MRLRGGSQQPVECLPDCGRGVSLPLLLLPTATAFLTAFISRFQALGTGGYLMAPQTPLLQPGQLQADSDAHLQPNMEEDLNYASVPYLVHTPVSTVASIPNLAHTSMPALIPAPTPTLLPTSTPIVPEPSPPNLVHCSVTILTPSCKESAKKDVAESLNAEEEDVLGCLERRESSSSCSCPTTSSKPDVDGGWAWIVFAAAFLQFFVSSGMYYSFSVFFVELLRTFEESRAKTGWVYSTNSAVHMFCGPLSGWLISRWGPRATVMIGGVLAGLGNIMTAFAPSLDVIFFTHGFVNAVGTSLNFCGWVVGLGRFWKRRHALIVGMAMSGSGFGVFFLGPLMDSIVHEYGWRGAMLICAGMSFNFSVFGATIYSKKRETPAPEGIYLEKQRLVIVDDVSKDTVTDCDALADSSSDDSLRKSKSSERDMTDKILTDTKAMPSLVAAGSVWSLAHYHHHNGRIKNWLYSLWYYLKNHSKFRNKLKDKQNAATSEGTKQRLLCSPSFWLLEASCFLSFMATTTMFAVFLDWTTWAGMSTAFSAALAGSGAGDLVGRLLAGALMGRGFPPLLLFSGIQTLLAAAIGFASLASTPRQLVAAMVGMGMACGLQSVLSALIPSQLSSGSGVGRVLGYLLLVTGAGALSGPPIAGVLVDQTNSYTPVMILCAAAPAAAGILNLVAHCTSPRAKNASSDR